MRSKAVAPVYHIFSLSLFAPLALLPRPPTLLSSFIRVSCPYCLLAPPPTMYKTRPHLANVHLTRVSQVSVTFFSASIRFTNSSLCLLVANVARRVPPTHAYFPSG